MMSDDVMVIAEEKMDKTLEALQRELSTMRAGRANVAVLDRILVDYYGAPTPIKQMANIATPEARLLTITPYDPKMISAVEKAIQTSDLGINPNNDGKIIRLVFPELTEERRKDLVKTIKKKGEEAKVGVRNIRRETVEQLKKQQKASEITEDDLKDCEADIQKTHDKKIAGIDKIIADKEKEIMAV